MNLVGQDEFVIFKCPDCGDNVIIRCNRCKKLSRSYKCSKCNFEGP
jgi:Zn-ribbon RNA-binding protein